MNFIKQLQSIDLFSAKTKQFDLWAGDQAIPLRFKPGRTGASTLFVSFHGSVDRSKRTPPVFLNFFPDVDENCHQLAVSDPTMLRDGKFRMSWYAGHHGFETQKILPELFQALQETLSAKRVIFCGSSGGGFAALYYGWHHPESVVIAANPQTKITEYHRPHADNYQTECWPKTPTNANLSEFICEDVRQLYAGEVPNTVLYVQSATDNFHLIRHMAPFLSSLSPTKNSRVNLQVEYFGTMGHAFSYDALSPWIRAVLMAKDTSIESILQARELVRRQLDTSKSKITHAPSPSSISAEALQMADALRDYQMRK